MFGFFAGPIAILRSLFLLLRHPVLLRRALLPAITTLIVVAVSLYVAVGYRSNLLAWLWPGMAGSSVVSGVFGVSAALLALFIAPWLVMLVGLPLCGPLAETADELLGGRAVDLGIFRSIKNTIMTTGAVLLVGLSVSIALFMLGLIPGIGLVSAPIALFFWTPLVFAFDLFDISLSRRELDFTRRRRFLIENLGYSISVGLTGMLCVAVPIVNLLGLPLAVLSAVIVVRDLEDKGRL
ncbi:MAG: hypothetical protein CMH52_07250 [Myxococcales bacterium]|nr:hypothetical protein [Myxococcales bacterium]